MVDGRACGRHGQEKALAMIAPSQQRIKRNSVRNAPGSKRNRTGKAATYIVDGVSVDVTDLLNVDFQVLDTLSDAMVRLSTGFASSSGDERANYLSEVLGDILDRQTNRVLELTARLSEMGNGVAPGGAPPHGVKPDIAAQCNRLNRLRDRAERIDYIGLHTGGQDNFSTMNISELQAVIQADRWFEIQIRLRASAMLTPTNLVKVARWVARGLDVRHALNKVRIDGEIYETDRRQGSSC